MWYKKRWLTEPDAEAMLEAKDKKIEELTEKLLSDDRQISAYDIEVNELRDKHLNECRQISEYDAENKALRELLSQVRSYYGQTESWVDLYEEKYKELMNDDT